MPGIGFAYSNTFTYRNIFVDAPKQFWEDTSIDNATQGNEMDIKVGDKVWIKMNSFGVATKVAGEVLALTSKRVKCFNEVRGTVGYYDPKMISAQ